MEVEDQELWHTLILKATWDAARNFPDIDKEDLIQDLYEFVLSTPTIVDPRRTGLLGLLKKQAKKMAWLQRKEHLQGTSQYNYCTDDVKKLLETVFDQEDWDGAWVPKDAQSEDATAPIEVRVDVLTRFAELPTQYRGCILRRYRDKVIDPPDSAGRKQLNRAVTRLTDMMNMYQPIRRDGPGTRKVMSNASAAFETQEKY